MRDSPYIVHNIHIYNIYIFIRASPIRAKEAHKGLGMPTRTRLTSARRLRDEVAQKNSGMPVRAKGPAHQGLAHKGSGGGPSGPGPEWAWPIRPCVT